MLDLIKRSSHLFIPLRLGKTLRLSSDTWGDQENLITNFKTLTLGSKQILSSGADSGGICNLNNC